MPDVSVVISVRNAARTIVSCLTAVRQSAGVQIELIIVDAGSIDGTPALAGKFADHLYTVPADVSRNKARFLGASHAQAPLVVNIDADVIIKQDTLRLMKDYFDRHPDVDAATGMLSREHPNQDFLSQYKNLYMYGMFASLPERVHFLYGSLYAFRRELTEFYPYEYELGEDTAFGQRLAARGKKIAFVKAVEVIHLKKYSFIEFVKNEFLISFYWAQIFLANGGWGQMVHGRGRFAHASGLQIAGVLLAPGMCIAFIIGFTYPLFFLIWIFMFYLWFSTQMRFLTLYIRERGLRFALAALVTAIGDDIFKALGISVGCVYYVIKRARKR